MKQKTILTERLRVAIVGGGIGGLSAAIALLRKGIDVTVFEQSDALGEVGAGVFIFPNGLRQLERMGLGKALAAVGAKVGDGSQYYRMDGNIVAPVLTTDSNGWNGLYGMHRADLLNALAGALPQSAIRTGHRCIDFEQNTVAATLKFANGETVETDVVIAADGIQSTLQGYVAERTSPEYSGSRAYRGLIAREKLPDWSHETHQIWMGDGKHFLVFPVRSGRLLNYVGFVPTKDETIESWSAVGDRAELAASFEGWDPRVTGLLGEGRELLLVGPLRPKAVIYLDKRQVGSPGRFGASHASASRSRRQPGHRRRHRFGDPVGGENFVGSLSDFAVI